MSRLSRWFINGLLAFLPISITVYVVWWLANFTESLFGAPLRRWLGYRGEEAGYYFYGLGIAVMIVFLVCIGLFLEFYLGKLFLSWSEGMLARIPIIKQVYSSIKEILDFFKPDSKFKNAGNYMVIVTILPDVKLLGYVTRDTLEDLKGDLGGKDDVVVILPFCYQMGGNTIIVPRHMVRPVDLSLEDGLKIALSGFVLTSESDNGASSPRTSSRKHLPEDAPLTE